MSPAALTPALALDLVRELSADVRAVLILSAGGERLAGPPELAAAAQALAAAAGDAPEAEAVTADGVVCLAARPDARRDRRLRPVRDPRRGARRPARGTGGDRGRSGPAGA